MQRSWLIPDPVRAFAAVLLAGLLGSVGGLLSESGPEDAFLPMFSRPALLRSGVEEALPGLEAVLRYSPEFEARDAEQGQAVPAELGEGEKRAPPYQEWGRREMYRTAFWRPNASTAGGPLEVQAETSMYGDINGARRAFAYWSERLATAAPALRPDVPADESAAYQMDSPPFVHQWVHFRKANGLGIVVVTGPSSQTMPDVAVELARRMAERMR